MAENIGKEVINYDNWYNYGTAYCKCSLQGKYYLCDAPSSSSGINPTLLMEDDTTEAERLSSSDQYRPALNEQWQVVQRETYPKGTRQWMLRTDPTRIYHEEEYINSSGLDYRTVWEVNY